DSPISQAVAAIVVVHGPCCPAGAASDGAVGHRSIEIDRAGIHGGRVDDGLERGSWLPETLSHRVELVLAVVHAADHRANFAGMGVQADQSSLRRAVAETSAQCALGFLLHGP